MPGIVGIIPARMGAGRFPGKPLADILGWPMVVHVYERARRCAALDDVVVATCDDEIRSVVEAYGGRAIMTSREHERGTDRVAEAARHFDADVIVNIQGDEPLLDPQMLEQVSGPFVRDPALFTCNLIKRLDTDAEYRDPNCVKVAFTPAMRALYFSREPIPTRRHRPDQPAFRQLGIIAFRAGFLQTFSRLPRTPLEAAESVDMMRVLEHGFPIALVETGGPAYSVDTPGDLEAVVARMRTDPMAAGYLARDWRGAGARGATP